MLSRSTWLGLLDLLSDYVASLTTLNQVLSISIYKIVDLSVARKLDRSIQDQK